MNEYYKNKIHYFAGFLFIFPFAIALNVCLILITHDSMTTISKSTRMKIIKYECTE